MIDQNEQLAGRFLAPVNLSRFRWTSLDERENFIGILQCFHRQLHSFIGLPELDSDPMAFRFWCATGGLIGPSLINLQFSIGPVRCTYDSAVFNQVKPLHGLPFCFLFQP